MPEIREIGCRSIMSRSRITGIDYTVNPYAGCLHGCVYCYAQFMKFNRSRSLQWGDTCDVRINAASVFRKQILRARPGLISLSTATDPYQPVEKKYGITRQILETLVPLPFKVSVLTKSDLVIRDIDILRKISRDRCTVGLSFSTVDIQTAGYFEPGAPSPERRLHALKTLHESGIRTWIFLAPLLPEFSLIHLEPFLRQIRDCVDHMMVDSLNLKGLPPRMAHVIQTRFPRQSEQWQRMFSEPGVAGRLIRETLNPVRKLITAMEIPVTFC